MYESFFGLRERPFELNPDPRFLCLTPRHREALSNLQYGISARKGMTLLVGEAGTGKTTVVRAALQSEATRSAQCVYVSNPTLTRAEFVEYLARGFGLTERASSSKTSLLFELERLLETRRASGRITALVVDEAQSLPFELLEEIRLLANIETASEKLLQVVLVGQPELADRLNDPSLRQLKQRIALRCTLGLLTAPETVAYIGRRIRIAGGDVATTFTEQAMALVHRHARGVPRTTSVICDNALVSSFAVGRRPVDHRIVAEVCRDFDTEAAPVDPVLQAAPARERVAIAPAPNVAASAAADRLFSAFGRRPRFSFF